MKTKVCGFFNLMLRSSIQSEGIRTFCPPETNLGMKVLETFASYWNILWAWGFWAILGSNIRQVKLKKFTKIFNYIKLSCAKLF